MSLRKVFDGWPAPDGAAALFDQADVAEFAASGCGSFFLGHAAQDEFFGSFVEVCADFFGEIAIKAAAREQSLEPVHDSLGDRTRVMPSSIRSKRGNFTLEMLRSGRCQLVDANAAVRGRSAPFRLHEPFLQQTLEGRIERAFFDLEQVVGCALDVLDEGIAVERLALERSENHHLEGSGEKVALLVFVHEAPCRSVNLGLYCSTPRVK